MSEENIFEIDLSSKKEIYESDSKAFNKAIEKDKKKAEKLEADEVREVLKGSQKSDYDRCQVLYFQGYEVEEVSRLSGVDEKTIKKWCFDKDWDIARQDIEEEKVRQIKEKIIVSEVAKGQKILDLVSPLVSLVQKHAFDALSKPKIKDMTTKELLSAFTNLGTLAAKITGELTETKDEGFQGPGGVWREWANSPKPTAPTHHFQRPKLVE